MAFGTPTDGGRVTSVQNGTSVSPAYPSPIAANDILVLVVGQKPSTANGGTVTTPTGWTLIESVLAAGGYGTTLAADTGNTNLFIYVKNTVTGTEAGNLTITVGTNNICWATIIRVPGVGLSSYSFGTADGQRTTAPTGGTPFTNLLTNGGSAPNIQAGDVAIWAMCIPTDSPTFATPTISSTGTTFGTPAFRAIFTGLGNDLGGYIAHATATAGSSTAAPTVGITANLTVTNVRGPIALIRLRDTTQPLTPARFDNTNAFYSAEITQATPAQNLAPSRYDNSNIFFEPTIAHGAVNLAPARHNNVNTFYLLHVTQDAWVINQHSRLDNINAFYPATITAGAVNLAPQRLNNANTIYGPTVLRGASNLAPARYDNISAFYAANIEEGAYALIQNARFNNANTFFQVVLDGGGVTIAPSRYDNDNAFFGATVATAGQSYGSFFAVF
jgi:hypothetical protein